MLASTLALAVLLFGWQPIPVTLYDPRETWATPHMTVGHLRLAAFMTGQVSLAIPLEERDLVATLGGA